MLIYHPSKRQMLFPVPHCPDHLGVKKFHAAETPYSALPDMSVSWTKTKTKTKKNPPQTKKKNQQKPKTKTKIFFLSFYSKQIFSTYVNEIKRLDRDNWSITFSLLQLQVKKG